MIMWKDMIYIYIYIHTHTRTQIHTQEPKIPQGVMSMFDKTENPFEETEMMDLEKVEDMTAPETKSQSSARGEKLNLEEVTCKMDETGLLILPKQESVVRILPDDEYAE
jgi:hypothetical protein